MKNRIHLLIALGFISLYAISCIDDKGNYVYEDASSIMPVTVANLPDTTILSNQHLRITPDVRNIDLNREYTYVWYTIPINAPERERRTLSREQVLDTIIRLLDGTYTLYFEVSDVALDIFVRKTARLTITPTEITSGWYVLKDMNDETDFDYINDEGTLYPDVLYWYGDNRLPGTAVKMVWQTQGYYHDTLRNQSAIHVLSSRDIRTFNARRLGEMYKEFDDQFYEVPASCDPQSVEITEAWDLFLLNAGKIHTVFGLTINVGKYAPPKVASPTYYNLFPKMIAPSGSTQVLVFDLESCSFYFTGSFISNLYRLPDRDNYPSPTNMDATLTDLLVRQRNYNNATGYAIMKNKSKEEHYIRGINFSGSTYPFTSFDTIPAGCKMPFAEAKAAPAAGAFVYFGDGNKLCVYKNASGLTDKEETLITFPEDETVSYLSSHYVSGSYNYLVVLTNNADGYKLYVYNVRALGNPDLLPDPVIYSGEGNGRYVMFRTTNMKFS